MKTIIRDEKGNEENIRYKGYNKGGHPFLKKIIVALAYLIFPLIFLLFLLIFMPFFILLIPSVAFGILLLIYFDEKITIDKGLKSVIIKPRWQKTEMINFSDIKEVRVTDEYCGDGLVNCLCVQIDIITNVGDKKIIFNSSYDYSEGSEEAKEIGVRVSKIIGVNLTLLHKTA